MSVQLPPHNKTSFERMLKAFQNDSKSANFCQSCGKIVTAEGNCGCSAINFSDNY